MHSVATKVDHVSLSFAADHSQCAQAEAICVEAHRYESVALSIGAADADAAMAAADVEVGVLAAAALNIGSARLFIGLLLVRGVGPQTLADGPLKDSAEAQRLVADSHDCRQVDVRIATC